MNRGFCYREQVGLGAASLVAHLARAHSHSTLAEWRTRLARGELEVAGRVVQTDGPVRPGEAIAWRRPPWEEPPVPLRYEVVHEDESLLVVNKPAGLPTLPAGGFLDHTLLALLEERAPGFVPVHRLGRGTSGLVACAREPTARERLGALFRGRALDKRYLALVQGRPHAPRVIEIPIGQVPHPKLGGVHAALVNGKPSTTLLESSRPRGAGAIVELGLVTGRPHQIRIHLAAIGHPLVGDPLYLEGGVPRSDALPGDGGYRLHAWRLSLTHPVTGAHLMLEAPAPAELA